MSLEEWTLSLAEPLPGTTARANAAVSSKLVDEEMALFAKAAQQQAY